MKLEDNQLIAGSSRQPEDLRRFLELYQDRVYNICYQVLRHPQDAEDASQQVLVKLLECLGTVGRVDEIPRWVSRVALNSAIDLRRRQSRRGDRERLASALKEPQTSTTVSNEAREAVQEALSALDDERRSLIVEHYFEKRPLAEIAAREGCSTVGVWKRLAKAKEELERCLREKGFASCILVVEPVLSSFSPVRAPSSLLGKSLLEGIGATAANPGAGALGATGGAAMASKAFFSTATVSAAILAMGLGIGGGVLVASASRTAEAQRAQELEERLRVTARSLEASRQEVARWKTQKPSLPPELVGEVDRLRAENDRLKRDLAGRPPAAEGSRPASLEATLKDFAALISGKGYGAISERAFAELAKRFGECGTEARRKLEEMLLVGKTPLERGLSAYMLETLKASDSVPSLERSLREDRDDMVRRFSSHALAMIRDEQAVPTLLGAMKNDADFGVRINAAYGLAKAGNEEAVAWLASTYEVPEKKEYRLIVFAALADAAPPSAAPLFRKVLEGPAEISMLTSAIEALEKMKDRDSLPALARILQGDASDSVKAAAEKAYAAISSQGAPK